VEISEKNPAFRVAGWAAAVAALALTLRVNFFTLAQISRASTRVPWADEWFMVQEFASWKRGGSLWSILWAPYWGHRLVVPRLIFFTDMQWASHAPLIWLTFGVQSALICLLISIAWKLFGRASPVRFALSCAVALNLMLSPAQMENFTWSMQTMFPLVYAAGAAAILTLAFGWRMRPALLFGVTTAFAMLASLTMPNGILVWPVLVAESAYLRLGRKMTLAIAFLGAAVISLYLWHYERPALGMGIGGMLRHPLDATMLVGLLLGAPFDSLPPSVAICVALAGAGGSGYLAARALRRGGERNPWASAIAGIGGFFLLSAVALVAGRLTPEWLHNRELGIPPRYFTLIFAFWSSIAILVLYARGERLVGPVAACGWAALFVSLMFFQPSHLLERAEDWADLFRGVDAMGAALLIDAHDEAMLRYVVDSPGVRDEGISFMRKERMGVFGEPLARWLGKRVSELWPIGRTSRCAGGMEFSDQVSGPGASAWRIEGWAVDQKSESALENLVVTASSGEIVGLARGGLRHRYIPGFGIETQTPIFHAGIRNAEWLGYVRADASKPWVIWGLEGLGICRVAEVN
jgi:hypothetical protein